jgi:hypothetical protein
MHTANFVNECGQF